MIRNYLRELWGGWSPCLPVAWRTTSIGDSLCTALSNSRVAMQSKWDRQIFPHSFREGARLSLPSVCCFTSFEEGWILFTLWGNFLIFVGKEFKMLYLTRKCNILTIGTVVGSLFHISKPWIGISFACVLCILTPMNAFFPPGWNVFRSQSPVFFPF